MFIFLVGIVTAIICIIYFIKEEEMFIYSVAITLLISFLSFLLACLISLIVTGFGMASDANYETIETRQDEIVCLQDNMSMSGRRYAYRAYINEKLQYTYLTNETGKGITSKQIPADDTYINYTEEQPRVIQRTMVFSNPILGFFSSGLETDYEYDLYLPEGSIAVEGEYNIDLQ